MKKYIYIIICFVAYYLYSFYALSITQDPSTFMIFINTFLALLPMLFADLLVFSLHKPRIPIIVILSFLWLIFFPNAPYMITDFIHIGVSEKVYYLPMSIDLLNSWVLYFYVGFGAIMGILMGLHSLYSIHQVLIRYKSRKLCWLIIISICLVSGFGIYLGRVQRLYSWDIIHPLKIFTAVKNDFDLSSLILTLLFALYVFGSYFVFYVISTKNNQQNKNSD